MSQFQGRNIFALWFHALIHFHRMAWIRAGFHGPKYRFCWECDRATIEADLGHSLEDRP